jgi:hypothetical protein
MLSICDKPNANLRIFIAQRRHTVAKKLSVFALKMI